MAEPSKEAIEVAKDIRQEWMRIALTEGKKLALPAGHLTLMATHLDRFAAQRREEAVQAERDRCGLIADEDAELGRGDLGDSGLASMAGARILAAERIALGIRDPSIPSVLSGASPHTGTEGTERSTRWRHKKRGTTYRVIGVAESQVVGEPVQEGARVVVYRSEQDGSLWIRPYDEFHDGRFECLPEPPRLS